MAVQAVESNVQVLSTTECDASFFKVRLVEGKASECFAEGTAAVPNSEGGFDIFVDTQDSRCLQKAGRSVGALGLLKVKVSLDESLKNTCTLNELSATQFTLGMYTETMERTGMAVGFALDEATLAAVKRNVTFITLGRIFANSPNNKYHTVELLETYVESLVKAFNEHGQNQGYGAGASASAGKLSFTMYKPGDEFFTNNCIGLETVGKSSSHEPCLGVLDFVGEGASEDVVDIALVGKGIAFDTGGNDIKPPKFMETMHTDKSGLVYVAAATVLAAAMGVKKHIRCYMPCAENMVSGNSMVPGDIITYPNGVTVEIGNTDAEGRLILADGLILASKDKPKFILDAATLTGAAKIAVGRDMCAVLCRSNKIDEQLEQAFNYTNEDFWCLPMREYHKRYITAKRADICNTSHGDGAPGSSTAAAFLSFFVDPNIKWTHLDLSNAYQRESSPYLGTGSTGSTIYALAHWLVGAQY